MMKWKNLRRTVAAVMALVIVSGTVPVIPGGRIMSAKPISASAAPGDYNVSFDVSTGVLTLSGKLPSNVVMDDYCQDARVETIVCAPGTVFPRNCSGFFNDIRAESIDISSADMSNVEDMSYMFSNCMNLRAIDLSGKVTSRVKTMSGMFNNCSSLTSIDVGSFNTVNVVYMDSMFKNCQKLEYLDLKGFETSKVLSMSSMFSGCSTIMNIDLSGFSTRGVESMVYMFSDCSILSRIYVSNSWRTAGNAYNIFENCKGLIGGQGTKYSNVLSNSEVDPIYARIDGGKDNPGLFTQGTWGK